MALRNKFILFFLVLLFLLGLQWALFVEHERSLLIEETVERAGVLVRTLAQLAREPLAGSQYSRLEDHLESVKLEKDVEYARIVSRGFRVLADTRKSEEGWIYSGEISKEFASEFSGGLILVRAPIEILGEIEGMAEIAFSLSSMREKISRNRVIFAEILVFQVLTGAAFYLLMNYQVLRPLRYLSEKVTSVPPEEDRHEIGVPKFASVEIRRVIGSVNGMRERLVAYQKDAVSKARFATMGKIAANMAHEIRNPLEAISGAVELLDPAAPAGSEASEYLTVIREEIRNLNEYLGEFLEFARPAPFNPEPLDLRLLLQETLLLVNPVARKRGIALSLDREGEPLLCRVDGNQTKRVFLNLILNGIEACGTGGRVEIRAAREGAFGVVRVLDDGRGIPREILDRLFEPYLTTKSKGTGLGLALSRRVVEQHGGTISIAGRTAGGTEATVKFPLEKER